MLIDPHASRACVGLKHAPKLSSLAKLVMYTHTNTRTTGMKLVVEQVNVDVCARARARISRGCDNACVRYVRDSVRVCACGGRRVQLRRPAERDVFART